MTRAEEIADLIIGMIWNQQDHREVHKANIAKALEDYAGEALARRDLEQFGESFVLNGKRIGPNEIYKSTSDYVKEAREEGAAQMRERAANIVEHKEPLLGRNIADAIRALSL